MKTIQNSKFKIQISKVCFAAACLFCRVVFAEPVQFVMDSPLCQSLQTTIYIVADRAEQATVSSGLYNTIEYAKKLCKDVDADNPESSVAKINQKGKGTYSVSPELARILDEAIRVSKWTGGYFDVTYRSMGGMFSTKDFRRLELDVEKQKLTVKSPGMILDLRYVLRGVMADQLSRYLKDKGWKNTFVEVSGVTMASGFDANGSWKVAVDDQSAGNAKKSLQYQVQDTAVATVTTARQKITDPITKKEAVTDLKAATVFTENATQAEGFATALLTLGKDRALTLLKQFPAMNAIMVDQNDQFVKNVRKVP